MKIPSLEDLFMRGILTIVAVIAAGQTIVWVLTKYGDVISGVGLVVVVARLVWWWTDRRRF